VLTYVLGKKMKFKTTKTRIAKQYSNNKNIKNKGFARYCNATKVLKNIEKTKPYTFKKCTAYREAILIL